MSALINLISLVHGSVYEYKKDCPDRDSPHNKKDKNNILAFEYTGFD
jgi:hypothetical protein